MLLLVVFLCHRHHDGQKRSKKRIGSLEGLGSFLVVATHKALPALQMEVLIFPSHNKFLNMQVTDDVRADELGLG